MGNFQNAPPKATMEIPQGIKNIYLKDVNFKNKPLTLQGFVVSTLPAEAFWGWFQRVVA